MTTDVEMSWRDFAACAGMDPDVFFPSGRGRLPADFTAALAVCARCPVADPCLCDAMRSELIGLRHGVRGGLTPVQRDGMARARRRAA